MCVAVSICVYTHFYTAICVCMYQYHFDPSHQHTMRAAELLTCYFMLFSSPNVYIIWPAG